MKDDRLERLARKTPAVIAAYFACGLGIRLLLSSNLEIDEAAFVGATHWSWGYGESQPPLYNWLVNIVVAATGYWPAIAAIKFSLLGAVFILIYDTARRVTGSCFLGSIAACSLALVYQLIWHAQNTLTHSVLVTAAAAATLHALALVLEKGRAINFAWLGVAVGAGLLSKYNFAIFLLSVAAAIAMTRDARQALSRPLALLSIGAAAILFLPHALWAIHHFDETTARLARFERVSIFGRIGVPFAWLQGLLSFAWAVVAMIGPMVAVRAVAARLSRHRRDFAGRTEENHCASMLCGTFRSVCKRTTLIVLSLCALSVLVGGVRSTMERYFTPLLLAFPFWFVLANVWPPGVSATRWFRRTSVAVAALCTLLLGLLPLVVAGPLSYPYSALARDLQTLQPPPFAILSARPGSAANLVLRIPGTELFNLEQPANEIMVVWPPQTHGPAGILPGELADDYLPVTPVRELTQRHTYFSGAEARINAQVWKRKTSTTPARR